MSLYQFNEIYYRVTGEYENDIQILFFEFGGKDILVYNGVFDLVNAPVQLNLSGFNRLFENNKTIYQILRVAGKFITTADDDLMDETYVELEEAAIRIAWHFSTASGQRVKDLELFFKDKNKAQYAELLEVMESANKEEINDLRFI